jgi:hypothetical protein
MASTIKVDNVQNQPGTNIINKCSVTTTIGAGAGETINVCGATVNIGRCGGTVALASGATQTGFGREGSVDWQPGSIKTGTFTAVTGEGYFVNTSGGTATVNLPAGAAGSIVAISDYTRTFNSNNCTVAPNGAEKIGGIAEDAVLTVDGQAATFVYVDGTEGWINVQETQTSQTGVSPFVLATGGNVITNCGDYKFHIFTGPGTLCVTNAGSPPGSTTVDYLVVAGGGGGYDASPGPSPGSRRSAGGGAGGYREGKNPASPHTASPLAAACSQLPVAVQGYPIAVGAGGGACTAGSVSSFSTIPSAGGGSGGGYGNPTGTAGGSGGSGGGGGASESGTASGGAGDTPPTSPAQGFDGGDGLPPGANTAGGGGGATVAGTDGRNNACSPSGGDGGDGAGTLIISGPTAPTYGSPGPSAPLRYYAGGGGGSHEGVVVAGGAGGGGTGGFNVPSPGCATNGTVNTGGGAGGNLASPAATSGGSGVVVIRYKFQ